MSNGSAGATRKQVATFTGSVTFSPVYHNETGEHREVAVVRDVQHPRLGAQPLVFTSLVETKCEDGESFETLNTIYRRASPTPTDAI